MALEEQSIMERHRVAARSLVEEAVRAPSSHNTQPWRFRVRDEIIDLFADRTRALPVNDPDDRELTISCGAALMNLRVAAAHVGVGVNVQLLPSEDEPDWLARVAPSELLDGPTEEAALFELIARRRTYRKRFAARPVPVDLVQRLINAASAEQARLHPILSESVRHEVAALVNQADTRQWANPSWRRELAAWMHPRRRGDGLTLPGLAVPVAQLVVRTFDMGGGIGARDRDLAEASPLLAMLDTAGDGARDWLHAGEALERVLLTACQLGLQASYLNQPIQEAALRPRLRQVVGGSGFPQLLLRIGYTAEDVPATPRREIADVLD
jgi:nitroreductase